MDSIARSASARSETYTPKDYEIFTFNQVLDRIEPNVRGRPDAGVSLMMKEREAYARVWKLLENAFDKGQVPTDYLQQMSQKGLDALLSICDCEAYIAELPAKWEVLFQKKEASVIDFANALEERCKGARFYKGISEMRGHETLGPIFKEVFSL